MIVITSDAGMIDSLRLEFPNVKFVDVQGGVARKRNIGTRFAHGEFIAFFDDDVEVTPYSIFYLFEALFRPNVGMVYGKLLNMEFRDRLDEAGSFLTSSGFLYARCQSGIKDTGQFEKSVPVLAGKSASCIVCRKIFWKVGGFDESYEILGEETDLSWRIWLFGKKVMYAPKSVTYHAFNTRFKPRDFYTPSRVYFNGCRNYIAMLVTNLGVSNLIIPIICQTCVWISAAVMFIVTGKTEAGRNIFKAFKYLIINSRSIIQKRKIVQRSRVVPDSVLLPKITHNPPLSYYIHRFIHYIRTGRHG